MIRPTLTIVSRRTFREWQRDRLVQIDAELEGLRAALKALQRRTTAVKRCDNCRVLKTTHLTTTGWWLCNRCAETKKEATA